MRIIIFIRNKNDKIPLFPLSKNFDTKYVIFESNKLEDLLLVAKYRILEYPTILVLNSNNRILIKVKGHIPNYINNLLLNA